MQKQKRCLGHMKNTVRYLLLVIFLAGTTTLSTSIASAETEKFQGENDRRDLLVTLPDIPPLAYEENGEKKGFLVDLVAAMDRTYRTQGVEIGGALKKGRIILKGIYPFNRSVLYVANGGSDFHIPFLTNRFTSADLMAKKLGIAYSAAFIGHANFPIYASKAFAALLPEFEKKIGKKIFRLETEEDFHKFDEFIKQNGITIEVDRTHTFFYPFTVFPSNCTLFSLKKLAAHRIDGYIHKMQECDAVLQANSIDTSNIIKIKFMKFGGRMLVPATEKGMETDKIISGLVWKLQGRSASEVPLEDTLCYGRQKEVPTNAYQFSDAFKNSDWYAIMGPMWDIPFIESIE